MKSANIGASTLAAEVTFFSAHGIWVLAGDREYWLPHARYPWFEGAKAVDVKNVQLLHGRHLSWPALDVELELKSLEYPEAYPLVYKQ